MQRAAGVVTFVFTDIEGSTRLLTTQTDAYPEIVRRHRAIIAEEATSWGGRVLGHEGDSCFIVFDRAPHAAAAMAAAQRRLESEPWPQDVAVRVRMGVHTGTAELLGDDYFGLAVHTASRVADAAHGGQIVLSDTTVEAGIPGELAIKDLGVHRLKHLDTPLRLHQLIGEGLRADFPPPRALPSMAGIRTPTTSFVGREAETAELLRILETSRLVTLLGPGGIGKTRFAFHVASLGGDMFPDGVWFADLTGIDDPQSVPDLIAESVGVSVRAGGNPISLVADLLGTARGLLIVDNLEHVIEATPEIARLAESTRDLRIVVTSRERLRTVPERVFEMSPLSLQPDGPAVRLFCERARSVKPEFDPSPAEIDDIVQICRRLDGLPLAIELAAARVRLMSPADIARGLETNAIALGGGGRDLHARQQTIRATVDWSYNLLDDEEKNLFSSLAVFAGPIRVDAIDHVLGNGTGTTADVLAGLIDKSLLQQRTDPAGNTRVRMLELVREFANTLLTERPDRDTLASAHAAYYAQCIEQTSREMLTDQPNVATRRLEADFADISRAFEWSTMHAPAMAVGFFATLGYFLHSTGRLHTGSRWEEQIRHVPVDPVLDARRAISAGYVAFGYRRLAEARVHWERAIPALADAGDGLNEAWATMSLGATHIGDPENHAQALELVERGIALADMAGSPVLVGLGFNIVGELSRVHGDDDAADAAYLAGAQVARTIDDYYREAITIGNRIFIACHRGDFDLAISLGKAAFDLHRRYGHHNQIPSVALALAGALPHIGRLEEAVVLVGAADAAHRRMRLEELPGDVGENNRSRAKVRGLAGEMFDEWYARGQTMPIEEALDRVPELG